MGLGKPTDFSKPHRTDLSCVEAFADIPQGGGMVLETDRSRDEGDRTVAASAAEAQEVGSSLSRTRNKCVF